MDISLDWYRVFYWTAKMGSLTKAAEYLHITQPAVSHTLKLLETALGGPLFFRTPKGVQVTVEGELLFRHIEEAMQVIALGEKKISAMQELSHGELNIGASDTLCKHYLLPHLARFHQQFPDIRIHVTNRTTPETIALLKEGKIDFGVVNLPVADAKVDFRVSSVLHDCLVGFEHYAALAKQPLPLADLHQYPLLLLEPGSRTRQYLDEYAASHGVTLKPEFELGSLDLLAQFAQSGFGLAFVVREFVKDEIAQGKLVELPLIPPIPERHVGIATLMGGPLSFATKRFLTFLTP